jgi:hypothetical protein
MVSVYRYNNIKLQNYLKNFCLTPIHYIKKPYEKNWIGYNKLYLGINKRFNNEQYQDEMKPFIPFIDQVYNIGKTNGYMMGNEFNLQQQVHIIPSDHNTTPYDRKFQISLLNQTVFKDTIYHKVSYENIYRPSYTFIFKYMVEGELELKYKYNSHIPKEYDLIAIDNKCDNKIEYDDFSKYKGKEKDAIKYGLFLMNVS